MDSHVCVGVPARPLANHMNKSIHLCRWNFEPLKNKIHSQDAKLRESLSALNWTLEDPSSIRLVYGGKPVETVRHYSSLADLCLTETCV